MTTFRKQYSLRCGSMTQDFRSKKPIMKDIETFHEQNSPTNNEVELVETLIKVPTLEVSKP